MDTTVYNLPVLVAGSTRDPGDDCFTLEYESGTTVRLHRPCAEDAAAVLASDPAPLRDIPFDDLTVFFTRVRAAWLDPDSYWRRMAVELGHLVTGYAPSIIESDAQYLGRTLDRAKQYDFVATDLGDPYLLDEWRPNRAVYTRCRPKGRIVHVMVGNVPLASLFALYRSLITKNLTVAKLPRRDVVSALCFANCIHSVDPGHPVTRALSTMYWEPGSAFEDEMIGAADVLSVWGRGQTVAALKRRLPHGVEMLEFGPKRSLGVVLPGAGDPVELGARIALDAAMYDQEACFSLQELYVADRVHDVAQGAAAALERYERAAPRRELSVDQEAHVQRARLEAAIEGWTVLAAPDTRWTVVVTDGPCRLPEHPLARFIYVHPIEHLAEVVSHVDRDVQTVGVAPWDRVWDVADAVSAAGADRVVPLGQMTRFRPGLTHDGLHPMARMVRWASVERPVAFKYMFADISPEEYDRRLYGPALPPQEVPA